MLFTRTIFLFPEREARDYRRQLVAIDDALVVVRRGADTLFELQPRVKLGAKAAIAQLVKLANELKATTRLVVIEPEPFFAELIASAAKAASVRQLPEVEAAAHIIAERSRYQIGDYLDGPDTQSSAIRRIIASRLRTTSVDRSRRNDTNYRNGIPVPRSEQMWRTYASTLLTPRDLQAAIMAWERWVDANRPDLPRHDRL